MPVSKVYTETMEALIRKLAEEGKTSTVIGAHVKLTRSAIISFCKRAKPPIVLQGSSGAQLGNSNAEKRRPTKAMKRAALAAYEEAALPVHSQCLWPDPPCTELRQSFKKPYCRAHNQLAFQKSIPKGTAKPVGYRWD